MKRVIIILYVEHGEPWPDKKLLVMKTGKELYFEQLKQLGLSCNGSFSRKLSSVQNDSTTAVTPDFDINGWEGTIDASFTFGGEE